MEADLKFYVQAIITVVLLTDPFVRPMLFKSMTAHEPDKRGAYVRTIMIVVGATLGPPERPIESRFIRPIAEEIDSRSPLA
ncbi:MAG TPA: hypothetical protein VKA47_14230 [Solirubrobacterales bacterium]|nr:hypothetical protein [Solirubrobacterales bacterium]